MFGRRSAGRAESIVPTMVEIPPKPEIPPFRQFEIGLPSGETMTVAAHYSKVVDGDRNFVQIVDYKWVNPFSWQPQGMWRPSTKPIISFRSYTYVKEI